MSAGITRCTLCDELVPYVNDATVLRFKLAPSWPLMVAKSQHLFPVGECPGTPELLADMENDPEVAQAYREMQAMAIIRGE